MKKTAKEFLKCVPVVGPACKSLRRAFLKLRAPFLVPSRQLRWRLRGARNLIVLQIGSNDGVATDPLHELLTKNLDWEAVLVEPVPALFEKLQASYCGRSKTRCLNVAVSDKDGEAAFYYLDEEAKNSGLGVPEWYDQVGSFNRSHITNCLGLEYDKFIKRFHIKTVSLGTLLRTNGITRVDVLHIDTEGHDWVILRQLDLAEIRPRIVLFENKHLTSSETEEFFSRFADKYMITNLGTDYLCRLRQP